MSGRSEKEVKSHEKMQLKLKELPSVFSDFYYYMYSNKSYTTIENYIMYVKEFAIFICDGEITSNFYKKVKPADVNRFFAQMRNIEKNGTYHRVSDSIRATKWSALNTFFNYLEKNDLIKNSPMSKTERPRVQDNPEVAFLTEEEMHAIMNNVKEKANKRMMSRDLALISLGLTTGLRVSALVQINIEDIDFENQTIRVIEKRGKTCNILFGNNVKENLLTWIEDRKKYFPKIDTDALFVSNYNERMTRDGVRVILKKYSAGITNKNVTPHVMRHSCATNLYEKTGDIYLCATVLNHQNVATTQRYAEISQSKKRSAANVLDGLI